MGETLLRTVAMFLLIILSVRVMGKRQVGQLQVPELVVTIIISQLAAEPISKPELSLFQAAAPIALLVLCELAMSALTLLSPGINKFFYGSPSFLINGGKVNKTEMRRQRVTVEDIFEAMRQTGISDPSQISCVVLETNGRISVLTGREKLRGLPAIAVCDGKPDPGGLEFYGHDAEWLDKQLACAGLNLPEVFLMTVDSDGKIFIIRQSETK